MSNFEEPGVEEPESEIPRIAVVGRPNVGKSSLVNLLLGEDRSIVTEIAGTTRDSISARYNAFGNEFILVDTVDEVLDAALSAEPIAEYTFHNNGVEASGIEGSTRHLVG